MKRRKFVDKEGNVVKTDEMKEKKVRKMIQKMSSGDSDFNRDEMLRENFSEVIGRADVGGNGGDRFIDDALVIQNRRASQVAKEQKKITVSASSGGDAICDQFSSSADVLIQPAAINKKVFNR